MRFPRLRFCCLAPSILLLAACGPRVAEPPPIVLISIDTLRSDRLPAYGYKAGATPSIDALRRDALLFERAYSHVPLTLPAHASLFTGLLPYQHGVRDNAGYRLAEAPPTLPELLRQRGYATGAAVSAVVLRRETGIARGFELYEDTIELGADPSLAAQQRPSGDSLNAVVPWLRDVKERPFFLFFHLYEPHTPLSPPEPFASRHSDPYDGEVAAADSTIGRLLDLLREIGVYERSVVVLLADHGEGLLDHGEREHGVLLYREALQVPLLLKLPRGERRGATSATPVQLADVMPTLLELAGAVVPAGLAGASLLGVDGSQSERGLYAESFYARLHFGWSELGSWVQGRWHFIEGPDPELYDLLADPAERRNLYGAEPAAAAALRARLAEHEHALVAPAPVDPELREQLAALGYLATPAAPKNDVELPDPKSRLQVLALLEEAQRLLGAGDHDGAAHRLEGILAVEPEMVDAWEQLARAYQAAGRQSEALAAQRDALRHSGGAPEQALALAPLLLASGELEEARLHARTALETFPAAAHNLIARMALLEGDLAGAEREARAAVERRGSQLTPVITLGEVLMAQERYQDVVALVAPVQAERSERALPDPRLPLLHAQALAALGRTPEAAAQRRRALALAEQLAAAHPTASGGHGYLIRLHLEQGDLDGALEAGRAALAQHGLAGEAAADLGLALLRAGRAAEAVEMLAPLAAAGDQHVLLPLGMALSDSGRQAEARAALETLLAHQPENPAALESLATVLLRERAFAAAATHLRRAVELEPERVNAWNLLAVALWQGRGDAAGAIAAWQRALALDPGRLEVWFNLGLVAADAGRLELAREALTRFIDEAPPGRFASEINTAQARLRSLDS